MSDKISIGVGVDASGVSTGLAAVKNAVNDFKHETKEGFKELGGEIGKVFAVAGIIESFKGIAEELHKVHKMSLQFGESAESIQRVAEAAKLCGVDVEAVAKSAAKVTINAKDAVGGNEKLSDAFKSIGIDAREFVDLPLEDKLVALSEGYEQAGSQAEKMAAMKDVLGKSYMELIPILAKGSDELKEMFANANVASNEAVENIAVTMEKLEHSFSTLKAYGAESLNVLITIFNNLCNAAAVAIAYVTNLTHGFGAAKEAAAAVLEGIDQAEKEEDERARKKLENAKKSATGDDLDKVNAAKKALEDEAKAEKELADLQADNAKKKEEYHLRHITLNERELEIKKRLQELDVADALAKTGDVATKVKNDNERLDLTKELEKNQDDKQKWIEKQAAEEQKEAEKNAKEQAKAELKAKKDALKDSESNLSKAEKSVDHVSIDSLRAIGGGVANANYQGLASREQLQKQAVDLAKEQVDQLKQVVAKLENKDSAPTGDGSFPL